MIESGLDILIFGGIVIGSYLITLVLFAALNAYIKLTSK